MEKFSSNNKIFCLTLLFVLIYLLPFLIYGENSNVLIHDNLDSTVAWFKVLSESGELLSSNNTIIPNIMGDLPRSVYSSEFNLIVWLYYFFTPFQAYVINQILMHLLAFVGMYLLLKKHFLRKESDYLIVAGVSLAFALLPFWPSGGLTVAGQPLVLFAFLNIRDREHSWKDWFIIILVPFYSSLVLAFSFFLFAMGLLWLYDLFCNRKANMKFLLALILMGSVFLLIEYRLVYSMFFNSEFQSHRETMKNYLVNSCGVKESLYKSIKNFIYGQYHAHSLQQYFIGLSGVIALFIMLIRRSYNQLMIKLIILTAIISLWYGFWEWNGWIFVKENYALLGAFNFGRFHFLHPLLWYLIFALALSKIANTLRIGKYLVIFLIICQCSFLFYSSDGLSEKRKDNPTFAGFYSEELFGEIKNYIGVDQKLYRVASIGLHPSIAQFNGYYTVDGYLANYPVEQKVQFRLLIESELRKNQQNRDYFDNWGNRAYLFVAELPRNYVITKNNDYRIRNLQFNTEIFKQMGGQYIFSAVPIENAESNNLFFEREFTHANSPWKIYLYKISL